MTGAERERCRRLAVQEFRQIAVHRIESIAMRFSRDPLVAKALLLVAAEIRTMPANYEAAAAALDRRDDLEDR